MRWGVISKASMYRKEIIRIDESKESRNGNNLKLPHVWDSAETHVIG